MDRPHLRSIGVNEFLRWSSEGFLTLSPKFQRRRVWPPKARAFLIDTIMRGMPIPKLYMRQYLEAKKSGTIHEIVDGQQRLRSVIDFHNDLFPLPKDSEGENAGKLFSQLDKAAQKAFLTYEFSVDLLVEALDADVLDVFARINSYSVPLNAQEKRNATYYGSFKTTVYQLGFQHLEFWKKHRILSDMSVARMKEAELTSELIVAMAAGLQDKKKSLDSFYKKWDDRFPYKHKTIARFQDVIDLIDQHLGSRLDSGRFRRPALFYSLFLAVYHLRYEGLGDFTGSKRSFGDAEGERLSEALGVLDDVLEAEVPPAPYLTFITACQRQTDNIEPRRKRLETILKQYSVTK
jgi:hypothetical protein